MTAHHCMGWRSFAVTNETGTETEQSVITLKGRDLWMMRQLLASASRGITSREHPGARLSAYVFNLRQQGVQIETVTETHGGEFEGHHGRYFLRSKVTPISGGEL